MRRSTRVTSNKIAAVSISSDESDSENELPKAPPKALSSSSSKTKKNQKTQNSDSSSESDIENYLKPADQIDLSSSFFETNKSEEGKSFESIEKDIFSGINRLSDSESDTEENEVFLEKTQVENKEPKPTTSKINFQQLHDYTQKIEEAKKFVEKYEAQKKIKQNKQRSKQLDEDELDISELLALGETKVDPSKLQSSTHSSDFESFSDSEKEDWEEVKEGESTDSKDIIPKDGVQITVELPGRMMQKKKGIDLVACMKRRLNRIRKENQVYIHKVHLLCWLGHGNYVNQVLNSQELLALALSLIPSKHCYPSERTDLSYLEQIVKWFNNTIPIVDKLYSKEVPIEKLLKTQINRKAAFNKKMLVYMFICVLRSLGIQCRLVLSFQVAPLRPPASELHSLSTKSEEKSDKNMKPEEKKGSNDTKGSSNKEGTSKNLEKVGLKDGKKIENKTKKDASRKSKDSSDNLKVNAPYKKNIKSEVQKTETSIKQKNTNKEKLRTTKKSTSSDMKSHEDTQLTSSKVPQLDGAADTDDSEPSTSQSIKKPNLKKLMQEDKNPCTVKKHTKRLKSLPTNKDLKSESSQRIPNNNNDTADSNSKSNSMANLSKLKSKSDVKRSTEQPKLKSVNLRKLKSESDVKRSTEKPKSKPVSRSSQTLHKSQYFNHNSPKRFGDIRNDIISIMKGRMAEERSYERRSLVKSYKHRNQDDYDSDYAPEPVKRKKPDSDDEIYEKSKVKVKRRVQVKKDGNEEEEKVKRGVDIWVEVFLESEEKWISADVTKGKVHCIKELYNRASHPVTYIVAWRNDNSLKDITQRYCPNWNTVTRKLRIDKKWWHNTLKSFEGRKTARDRDEDEELAQLQLDQPLPTSIAEYKNHPLYVLKRHLLKFEALYPPQPITLGFLKDEAVYSRDCVHTLHSREVWIKYAKVVKPGEEPYKIVKARSKYDKLSGQVISDKPLELFGKWQVTDYVPPVAENGVVPRNAYGNVELFKPSMLPKGTVHLQLPGLNKVANKLSIDCAQAVVGFDFHSGGSHPTFDGFVVCEEYSEILIAAWYMQLEEQEKKEKEKTEKRIYGNWKKLIKGLLIRERLKARYNFGGPSQADGQKRKSKGPKFVSKKRRICSDSESDNDD